MSVRIVVDSTADLQPADSGLSAKQIAERLEQEKKNVCIIAMLDTLE